MARPSNAELLTQGEHYIKRKKAKQAKEQIEAVTFDDTARACVAVAAPFNPTWVVASHLRA